MRTAIRVVGPSIAYLPLTQGRFATIDIDDAATLEAYRWSAHWDRTRTHLRVVSTIQRKTTHIGRLLLHASSGKVVDHVNGRPLDNRRANLRVVTVRQNAMNMGLSKRSHTGFRGVTWRHDRQCYMGRVFIGTKAAFQGHYMTAEEAAAAVSMFRKQLHGEFWRAV